MAARPPASSVSLVPLIFTVLFLMSVLMTSGYLMQGTATEKENKVVDVLLASANPDEILAGKLLGLGGSGAPADRRVAALRSRRRDRRRAAAHELADRDAVGGAGAGDPALPHRVSVLRQPDARHRLARFEHARGAAAGDGLVADRGAAADDDGRPPAGAARHGGARDDVAAVLGRSAHHVSREHRSRLRSPGGKSPDRLRSCSCRRGWRSASAPGCSASAC